jgi:hypothetical protein
VQGAAQRIVSEERAAADAVGRDEGDTIQHYLPHLDDLARNIVGAPFRTSEPVGRNGALLPLGEQVCEEVQAIAYVPRRAVIAIDEHAKRLRLSARCARHDLDEDPRLVRAGSRNVIEVFRGDARALGKPCLHPFRFEPQGNALSSRDKCSSSIDVPIELSSRFGDPERVDLIRGKGKVWYVPTRSALDADGSSAG